jgi:hypothetical protein
MRNKRFRKALGLVACLGFLGLPGCEEVGKDHEVDYNGGQGRADFIVNLWGHMYNGERRQTVADVKKGATYNVKMVCSNDGDSDLIKVSADGKNIISYRTAENRHSGSGWYMDQLATGQPFTAVSNQVVFEVETKTDSWGTWPKSLELTEVQSD